MGAQTCGEFLDYIEARRDRLYELYHLTATRGFRRGEVCGIRWADTDLDDTHSIAVLESDEDDDGLKSEASWRTVGLDAENIGNLKAWRARQNRERLAAGHAWTTPG